VPGFLGCDLYLTEMYLWLRRMGYRPHMSHIGQNAECPDLLIHRLMSTVNRVYAQTGEPIHLIGHSLGGVLARGIAARRPDRVASITTLGSPFRGVRVNPWVYRTIEYVRKRIHGRRSRGKQCFTTSCACGFSCTMRYDFPAELPQTAIYTKSDGVVDWPVCINDDPKTDVEVTGTHVGLVWNAEVYRVVAKRLSEANDFRREAESAATTRKTARKSAAKSTKTKRAAKRTSPLNGASKARESASVATDATASVPAPKEARPKPVVRRAKQRAQGAPPVRRQSRVT
jgi:pimeloyl-ACP methyl ester carboxylesterase